MSAGAVAVKGSFTISADESWTRASYRASFKEQRVVATVDVSASAMGHANRRVSPITLVSRAGSERHPATYVSLDLEDFQ